MSKCGRNTSSITAMSFSLSFLSSSRWPAMVVSSWCAISLTTCSGLCWAGTCAAASWANTGDAATAPNAMAMAKARVRNMGKTPWGSRRSVLAGGGIGGGVFLLGRRAVDQELADQILELHGRLGQHHLVTVLEHLRRAAGLDRNVLGAD